ncbi:LOW QUALITY PROTEIN: epoxide hydrolase 1 [Phaethornis superciliosus]
MEDSCFPGTNLVYLRKAVSYRKNSFNWKKQVEVLKKYPQFKTKIQGIDTHLVTVKPLHLLQGSAKPLLIVYGWPGSFYELYKIIPLLTDPVSRGLRDEHIYEVICPSIPGYGFSEAPHKRDFNSLSAASVFYELMFKLFNKFYTQDLLSILLGHFGFQDEDVKWIFPFLNKELYRILLEYDCAHIQATKPDTTVPTGIASFPNEITHAPQVWAQKKYTKIVSFHFMPGGHFAALEEPELLAEGILQFVGQVEKGQLWRKESNSPNEQLSNC